MTGSLGRAAWGTTHLPGPQEFALRMAEWFGMGGRGRGKGRGRDRGMARKRAQEELALETSPESSNEEMEDGERAQVY